MPDGETIEHLGQSGTVGSIATSELDTVCALCTLNR